MDEYGLARDKRLINKSTDLLRDDASAGIVSVEESIRRLVLPGKGQVADTMRGPQIWQLPPCAIDHVADLVHLDKFAVLAGLSVGYKYTILDARRHGLWFGGLPQALACCLGQAA